MIRRALLPFSFLLLSFIEPTPVPSQPGQGGRPQELGGGTGWFDPTPFHRNVATTYLALGDLDQDADLDPDLYTAHYAFEATHRNDGGAFNLSSATGAFDRGDVALGDLDGDGDLDAFVGGWEENAGGAPSRVRLNNGIFNFTDAGFDYGVEQTVSVALGDLDGDDDLDAVALNQGGANQIWLNLDQQGGAPGEFAAGQTLGTGTFGSLGLADLDDDGDLDLVIPEDGLARIYVNTAGILTDSGVTLGDVPASLHVALADLDGDDLPDAFVSTNLAETIWINTSPPGGPISFVDNGQRLGADLRASLGVALGDLDGDLDADAVVTRFPNSLGNPFLADAPLVTITVWFNDGSGSFRMSGQCFAQTTPPAEPDECVLGLGFTTGWAQSPALGDVDGDGDLDLVTAHCDGFRVWYNGAAPGTDECCAAELAAYGIDAGAASARAHDRSRLRSAMELLSRLGTILGELDLGTYFHARDELLPGSTDGQAYLDFYEAHGDELVALLAADPALALDGASTLASWNDNVQALIDDAGSTAVITQEQIDALGAFLDDVSAVGSPDLEQAIAQRLAAVPPLQELVGATMAEARDDVIGPPVGSPIFADGFESGDTSAWSVTVP